MAVRVLQEVRLGALWYSIRLLATYGLLSYTFYIQETYGAPLPSKKPPVNAKGGPDMYVLLYRCTYHYYILDTGHIKIL